VHGGIVPVNIVPVCDGIAESVVEPVRSECGYVVPPRKFFD
jgi:4-aminobutyrate aminotransferase-like enzyme